MKVFEAVPRDGDWLQKFDAFEKELGDWRRFDEFDLDLGECVGELFSVLGAAGGTMLTAAAARDLEIDDNTGRIASVSPNPVCTNAHLVLTARQGQPFVERPGVTVAFLHALDWQRTSRGTRRR